MAVESALANTVTGLVPNQAPRRDESINPAATIDSRQPGAASTATAPDINLDIGTADNQRQALLDQVGANQQAREAVNQVQDSLIEQRELAQATAQAPAAERPGLEERQAEIQTARTEVVENSPSLQTGAAETPAAGLAAELQDSELVGAADPLPGEAQLAAGIERLGEVQQDLNNAEITLQSEFDRLQAEQFRTQPAQQITNPSEADAVLSRIQEQASDLPRTSNAVDDEQRQQALNMMQI